MKPHPDDNIFKVKDFINELSRVQDSYFEKLCEELEFEELSRLKTHLFDYIHNEDRMITFGEYLDEFGCGDLWDGL
jgi:CRISPR/Cas system-associated endoribonuclease Cas2